MAADRRMITLRRGGRCAGCGRPMDAGTPAWWDPDARSTTCTTCRPSAGPLGSILPGPPPGTTDGGVDGEGGTYGGRGTPGGSAQREYERRRSAREQRIRSAHPHVGGLLLAFTEDPPSTTAWAKGAEGERKVAARLEGLAQAGVVVLHDRRVPRSRANLDHLAVGPSGVYVIDAKRYAGQVARRDVGGWFRRDVRLFVGRRECSRDVAGAVRQADLVKRALAAHPDVGSVPVVPVLCFVDAEWSLFARPFVLGQVHVAWPTATAQLVGRPGPLAPDAVSSLAATVAAAFPAYEAAPS